MKKTCYLQEKMAASRKCFEDQNFLKFYLIQPLSQGAGGWELGGGGLVLRRGSRQGV